MFEPISGGISRPFGFLLCTVTIHGHNCIFRKKRKNTPKYFSVCFFVPLRGVDCDKATPELKKELEAIVPLRGVDCEFTNLYIRGVAIVPLRGVDCFLGEAAESLCKLRYCPLAGRGLRPAAPGWCTACRPRYCPLAGCGLRRQSCTNSAAVLCAGASETSLLFIVYHAAWGK